MTFLTENRPVLMIFMVIAIILRTIYHIKRCDTYRKDAGCGKDALEENLISDIVINSVTIIAFLLLFFVGFPQLVFYSATKFIYMVIFFIGTILAQVAYFNLGADIYMSPYGSVLDELFGTIFAGCFVLRLLLFLIIATLSISGNYGHFFGKIISQDESVSYLYPESVGEVKIAHIIDTNEYVFFTDEDGILTLNKFVFNEEDIVKESDETFIQVTTIQKYGIDGDRKKDDPEYAYTEESEKSRLFINEEEMILIRFNE